MDLTQIDDDPGLLEFVFYGDSLHLWPLVRWEVLNRLRAREDSSYRYGHERAGRPSLRDMMRYAWFVIRRSPLRIRGEYRYLIMTTAIASTEKVEGRYFNRLDDYYALARPDQTLIIEASHQMRIHEPRYPPHLAYRDVIKIRAAVAGALRRVPRRDARSIAAFCEYLQRRYPALTGGDIQQLGGYLAVLRRRLPTYERLYKKLLLRLRPRLLLLNCACYGIDAYLMRWSRELGITVGEIQHGSITEHHIAYNHSPLMCSAPMRGYLPDYLLLYGSAWARVMTNGIRKVIVGNPHLESMSSRYPHDPRGRVLIVSQWTLTKEFLAIAIALAGRLGKGLRVVLRPHPAELLSVSQQEQLAGAGVEIDRDVNLYRSMASAVCVVGCYSTALFEARGIGLPVFVLANSYSSYRIFELIGHKFSDAEQLQRLVSSETALGAGGVASEELWQPGWASRYGSFLDDLDSGRVG